MRTKPILGKKLWFEPRGWGGWGWTPVSWEGWVVLALFVVISLALALVMDDVDSITPVTVLTVALLVVSWLKGTSPGGPAAKRRLQIQRERDEEERRKRA